jgi:hypothetical protein
VPERLKGYRKEDQAKDDHGKNPAIFSFSMI